MERIFSPISRSNKYVHTHMICTFGIILANIFDLLQLLGTLVTYAIVTMQLTPTSQNSQWMDLKNNTDYCNMCHLLCTKDIA